MESSIAGVESVFSEVMISSSVRVAFSERASIRDWRMASSGAPSPPPTRMVMARLGRSVMGFLRKRLAT